MDNKRKLKLAKLRNKKPQPVVVDMTGVEKAIVSLVSTVESVVKQHQSDVEAFSGHLSSLEGLVKGALEKDNTEALTEALEKIKITSNTKSEIKIPKFDVPAPQVKVVNVNEDIYATYKASDQDIRDQEAYYGFLNKSGSWFIIRQTGDEKASYRYVFGSSKYKDSWTKRDSLNYGTYDED